MKSQPRHRGRHCPASAGQFIGVCGRFYLLSGFGKRRVGPSRIAQPLTAYFFPNGSKPNFWPPTLASNMRPPLPVVKTATPFWYLAFVDAPLVAATALA